MKRVVDNKRWTYRVCVVWNVFASDWPAQDDVAYKLKVSTSCVCGVIHGHFETTRPQQ